MPAWYKRTHLRWAQGQIWQRKVGDVKVAWRARSSLSSVALSLQAFCNPRQSPWSSLHRDAENQWKSPSYLPTISCPTPSWDVKACSHKPSSLLPAPWFGPAKLEGVSLYLKSFYKVRSGPHGVLPTSPIAVGCCMGGETQWSDSQQCLVGRCHDAI